jgi:SAM-dependent methyltransferase
MSSADLKDQASAERYYALRFSEGYMRDWPTAKLTRVADLVRELRLPERGRFLDFGCGTGVFTEVLASVLSGWSGAGVDIVDSALEQAGARCPGVAFSRIERLEGTYDFVFSHHVLEHVLDLDSSIGSIAGACAPGGTVLTIMPCGNPGSLEHRLCEAIEGRVDASRGGRFFFEDEGHVRRLTSAELSAGFAHHGLVEERAYFANHHVGALKWMTDQTPEWIAQTLDPARAKTPADAEFVEGIRRDALSLRRRRRPQSRLVPGLEWRLAKPRLSWIEWAALIVSNPRTLGSRAADQEVDAQEEREWRVRRDDPAGSEMFVVSRRLP